MLLFQQFYYIDTIIICTLQVRKQGYREVNLLKIDQPENSRTLDPSMVSPHYQRVSMGGEHNGNCGKLLLLPRGVVLSTPSSPPVLEPADYLFRRLFLFQTSSPSCPPISIYRRTSLGQRLCTIPQL